MALAMEHLGGSINWTYQDLSHKFCLYLIVGILLSGELFVIAIISTNRKKKKEESCSSKAPMLKKMNKDVDSSGKPWAIPLLSVACLSSAAKMKECR